jgi:signal transduction histidine kinase
VAYQKNGQYALAVAIYDSILLQSKKENKEYARVLTNLATVRWQQNSDYRASAELLTALRIRKAEKDEWGLNSSYAHLADYYARTQPDSALDYAREMYAVATRLQSPDDRLEALEKLVALSPSREVKSFFAQYRLLKDSLEMARNGAKNQFALIRYGVEKNKADNLRLLRQYAEKRAEVVQQQAIGIGVIIVFVMLSSWAIFWYRKRKQRMESDRQEERLRISQKVHDVVANGIYRVMAEVEHRNDWEKDKLLDQLDDLYLQSRDISYEPTGGAGADFQARVTGILAPYGRPDRKVLITGNDIGVWQGIGASTKQVLEPVIGELMVNMDKHSGARNVVVRFEREGKGLKLSYSDDGVGVPPDFRYGNGLTNTGNRISGIGGSLIFDRNTPSGLKVRIFFPND